VALKPVRDATGNPEMLSNWITILPVIVGLFFIILSIIIAIFIPHPTDHQIFIFRVVLALAAAAFGVAIPGFINIKFPLWGKGIIKAGGAIALFIIVYMINPPQMVKGNDLPQELPLIEQKLCGALWYKEEPLQGVVVTIQELNQQTQTDTQGRFCFTIKAVKEDKVRLMLQKEGFETLLEDATLGNVNLAYKMSEIPRPRRGAS
jgi:hypothetical protein